jgi:hypothetical protein
MRWSLFFHVIKLVTIHDSLSSHRTMILATEWACHQAPKMHCTISHNMLHMFVMSSINLEITPLCCSQRNFVHEIHEVFKD